MTYANADILYAKNRELAKLYKAYKQSKSETFHTWKTEEGLWEWEQAPAAPVVSGGDAYTKDDTADTIALLANWYKESRDILVDSKGKVLANTQKYAIDSAIKQVISRRAYKTYEWDVYGDDSPGELYNAWARKVGREKKPDKRQQLRNNLVVKVRSRHDPLRQDCNPAELQARLLLRDMLAEKEWRRYVTNGFIMVRGQSGRWYQVFADGRRTVVYLNGEKTHELCVHTADVCPPTDHVVNLKTLIEIDETLVWKKSNVTRYGGASDLIFAA